MKTIVAGGLGECVHVAGITNFLRLAENAGWRTVFLGPAVQIETFLEAVRREKADLVGVSYRLTPETGERLLGEFAEAADELHTQGVRFVFGGTPPVVKKAQSLQFFEQVFDGTESPDFTLSFLMGGSTREPAVEDFPQTTIERIKWKAPYPLIRHHFGLPTLKDTLEGISLIAESGYIDVISLGTDQDAQENFFHPERQNPRRRGAGGVPVRSPQDFREIKEVSQKGNYPLMRTYSGTDDFLRLAEMYVETIDIAWAAIPLYWFNRMDGRGPWDLEGSVREHQKLMSWYGQRKIPVEVNEPHHWGLRDAPDVVFTVAAFLSAYNARAYGVKDYIAQLMFNSPPGLSDSMDLTKMLAILDMIKPLAGPDFRIWLETRTGLLSYPVDRDAARAHLSTSIYLQMTLHPHIVHVVGYTEADHAATAIEVIESCRLARRSIENAMGQPDMTYDPLIQERKEQIINESNQMIKEILSLAPTGVVDPLADAATLTNAVSCGILDAPQLINNPYAKGKIRTHIDRNGACVTIPQ